MVATICVLLSAGNPFLSDNRQLSNPIPNPSFENQIASGIPTGWRMQTWGGVSQFAVDVIGHQGAKSVRIHSESGVDGGWQTTVPVKPFSKYRLSAWIKTENVVALTGQGALLNLHGRPEHTEAITGTHGWTQVSMNIDTGGDDSLTLNCLMGYFGTAKGTAWFDDLEMTMLSTKELKPTATIDISKTSEPISKYIFGQFIEHLGRCIYSGIWAEMLQDRKFFYPVGSKESPWKLAPYSGGDSKSADISGNLAESASLNVVLEIRGSMSQSGISLRKGREYAGYIWLHGNGNNRTVVVSVGLYSVVADEPTSGWKKTEFHFRALEDSDDASFSVSSRESFFVGPVSLMPANNVHGMRADTLKLLKQLNAPIYRWPGGNFVSGYDWKDGIGDRDKRPTRKNPAWQGYDTNDFGLHEFMDFCKLVGAEPEVVVNTGQGTVRMADDEVAYCNASADSPMGKLRAQNGHKAPFNVKWWGVGNEMYGDWQIGHVALSKYTQRHNAFVKAMRMVDPNIKLIAVGENYGGWTKGMFENCADNMDLISEHFYCQERPSVYGHTSQIAEQIRNKVKTHRALMKSVPQVKGKNIKIAMDEWNYWYGPYVFGELGTRYFWKDGLGIARGLHEYFRSTDAVFLAMYAQTVNVIGCIKTTPTAAEFETTGLILMLYRQHFGTIPVEVGGAPEPLDVSAALSSDKKALTIAIVNPMPDMIEMPITFKSATKLGDGRAWTIVNKDPMAYNDPGRPRNVDIVERQAPAPKGAIKVPGYSVTLFRFPMK